MGSAFPTTAEQLMRSRYTAFVKTEVKYLKSTLAHESQSDFDFADTLRWAKKSKWKGLKILKTENGQSGDTKGMVEFIATYTVDSQTIDHHEVSQFKKNDEGHWVFVDGESHTHNEGENPHQAKPQTVVRAAPKVGRNDPCPCGSGKKFKKCCEISA
jgi:SEC-C motif-containing protein